MEGERIAYTHEVEPQHGVRILASGQVDESVLDRFGALRSATEKTLGTRATCAKTSRMKSRHAAALALVGWTLFVPEIGKTLPKECLGCEYDLSAQPWLGPTFTTKASARRQGMIGCLTCT